MSVIPSEARDLWSAGGALVRSGTPPTLHRSLAHARDDTRLQSGSQEEFVLPHRVASVLGFGGLVPSGDLFATILFSRVPLAAQVAANFAPLALTVKLCLMPYSDRVFDS